LLFISSVSAACSSWTHDPDPGGSTGAAGGSSGTAVDPERAEASASGGCPIAPNGPIPAGTCPGLVSHCEVGPDECLGAGLKAAIRPVLAQCGVSCGELDVGFSAGCATVVKNIYGSDDTVAACVRDQLMQFRFDCVPQDGWQRVYIASCTLP
jgi:hypothetical protein